MTTKLLLRKVCSSSVEAHVIVFVKPPTISCSDILLKFQYSKNPQAKIYIFPEISLRLFLIYLMFNDIANGN